MRLDKKKFKPYFLNDYQEKFQMKLKKKKVEFNNYLPKCLIPKIGSYYRLKLNTKLYLSLSLNSDFQWVYVLDLLSPLFFFSETMKLTTGLDLEVPFIRNIAG